MRWTVTFHKKTPKQISKIDDKKIKEIVRALVADLEVNGPSVNWPNMGKLSGANQLYHCHLKKGRPTYVACWQVKDKENRILEIYYVGTHENAPY